MSGKHIFVDSNILIYAHDIDAQEKYRIAKAKIKQLWDTEPPPAISVQVLQECYVTFLRKNLPPKTARQIIINYMEWEVVENDRLVLMEGMNIKEKYHISLWDALIVAAAKQIRAEIILSEDLSSRQSYEGIFVINPFHP